MFTGLAETIGRIADVSPHGSGKNFTIAAKRSPFDVRIGDSVAVDGVCLTVVKISKDSFTADAVEETLQRTTLSERRVGDLVNLERSLAMGDRVGGHFVQGHVDGIGVIAGIDHLSLGKRLIIDLDERLMPFIVEKGSIAVDGLSLTVAAVGQNRIEIAIIPHTWEVTALRFKGVGDRVNIETDIIGKYVLKMLQPFQAAEKLSWEKLSQMGYDD